MFRRILAALVLLTVVAALIVVAWPQVFGLQRQAGFTQLIAFRGFAIIGAFVAIVFFGLIALISRGARRFAGSLALVFLVFALASTAVLASRGLGAENFPAKKAGDLTVMSWNTRGSAPGAPAIAKLALESDADIVSLPETNRGTTTQVATILAAAGHPMIVHSISFGETFEIRSTSVLVSQKLGDYHVDAKSGSTSVLPSVVLLPDSGKGPEIIAVHAVAPNEGQMANWRSDLRWFDKRCGAGNVIMAGDFNSTIDHYGGLSSVAGAALGRCRDAASASGNGAVGTWPVSLPSLLGTQIDHVMATDNWTVTGSRVVTTLDAAGSDHRPIIVQLSPRE